MTRKHVAEPTQRQSLETAELNSCWGGGHLLKRLSLFKVQGLRAAEPKTRAANRLIMNSSLAGSIAQLMQCVHKCNRGFERRAEFLPFSVESKVVGYVHPSFAEHLKEFPRVFRLSDKNVQINDKLESPEQRTAAVEEALQVLRDRGLVPGWRNEHYPVVLSFDSPALFSMERAAVPFFGTRAYGVHMNGFVVAEEEMLWVARRSKTKQTYPGCWDHLVAGGQPVGLSCQENLVKECQEEAGIPESTARLAIPAGAVSYEDINGEQYKRDVLFCYDLELPTNFQPSNTDGEVEEFMLKSVPEVIANLASYKPNCAIVVIDFLIRHGYLKPEQKGYLQLLHSLRTGECI